MPKIRETLPESVFYLYRQEPRRRTTGPWGTGFLILRSSSNTMGKPHAYGVSNWHVVAGKCGASIIRINTRDGRSRMIELDPAEWDFATEGDDLAIVDLSEKIDLNEDKITGLYEDMFVTQDWISRFQIGLGENVFMCGLFADHHGGKRNVPVVRFGNLSMMTSDVAPIKLETGAKQPCYLVDTRSRGGFSGSPVFVYRSSGDDLNWLPYGENRSNKIFAPTSADPFWGLLGIHCGQFWEEIQVKKSKRGEAKPIIEGDRLQIQGGMTIVIPAWRIKSLLDSRVFEMGRQKRDADDDADASRRPRPESAR